MNERCQRCGSALAVGTGKCPLCDAAARTEGSVIAPLAELRPEAEPPLPAAHDLLRTRTPPLGSGAMRRDPTPVPVKEPPSSVRSVVAARVESPIDSAPGPIVDPSAWFEEKKVKEPEPNPLPPLPPTREGEPQRLRVPSMIGDLMTPTPRQLPSRPAVQAIAEAEADADADADGDPDADAIGATEAAPYGNDPEPRDQALEELDRDRATSRGHNLRPTTAIAPPAYLGVVPSLVEKKPLRRAFVAVLMCLAVGAAVGWWLSSPEPPTSDELRARGAATTKQR